MAKKKTHKGAHKYRRIQWRSRQKTDTAYYVFKCQIPGCTTFKVRELVIGDMCICWRCEDTFQMTYASTYLAKPHCPKCTETKGPVNIDSVISNLDKLLEG